MDDRRARELVAAERERIEAALRDLTGELGEESELAAQQEGETDAGSELATEMTEDALIQNLRAELAAVGPGRGADRGGHLRPVRRERGAEPG